MDMKDFHERTGEEIQRAAKDLPKGYEITITIENGYADVRLFVPPFSYGEDGEVVDFDGDDFPYKIKNAIDYAIDHKINADL